MVQSQGEGMGSALAVPKAPNGQNLARAGGRRAGAGCRREAARCGAHGPVSRLPPPPWQINTHLFLSALLGSPESPPISNYPLLKPALPRGARHGVRAAAKDGLHPCRHLWADGCRAGRAVWPAAATCRSPGLYVGLQPAARARGQAVHGQPPADDGRGGDAQGHDRDGAARAAGARPAPLRTAPLLLPAARLAPRCTRHTLTPRCMHSKRTIHRWWSRHRSCRRAHSCRCKIRTSRCGASQRAWTRRVRFVCCVRAVVCVQLCACMASRYKITTSRCGLLSAHPALHVWLLPPAHC